MTQESENNEQESLDLDDLRAMEEAIIFSYLNGENIDASGEIDGEFDGELIAKITLARMSLEIKKELKEIGPEISSEENASDIGEDYMRNKIEIEKIRSISHRVLNYFVLSSILIESLTIELLEKELIIEEYSNSKKTNNLIKHRLNQKSREDFLFRTGIIDNSLKSELKHIRDIRNSLVHNLADYLYLEAVDSVPSEIDRVYNTYSRLLDEVSEEDTISLSVSMDVE